METLPPEVLVQVAPYLSVKDLATCCAVSHWWRDVFGCDKVWRPRCDPVMAEHLEKTPCRVEPTFSCSQPEDSSLSPIGLWRLAFMRETHLWRNWIRGNCKTEETGMKEKGTFSFLNSDIIIVINKNMFMLMDTSTNPPVCGRQLKVYPSEQEVYAPTVVKSDMIITVNHENIVQVIEVNLEELTLSMKHSFCINDSLREKGHYIEHFVVNTVLMGFENKCIYIWDLVKGTKLKTEHFSLDKQLLTQSEYCEDVAITGYADDGLYRYLIYNTKELTFWPMVLHETEYNVCKIMKDYIAIALGVTLKVYKYKTSQLVYELPMTELTFFSLHVLMDSFLYMKNDVLQQLVPSSGSIRCIMKSNVVSCKPLGEKPLLVLYSDSRMQIWKIGPVSAVETLTPCKGSMEINETFSKALLPRSGELLYFW